ncbi:BrnA antitoxin family protein [uncultured Sphingomonas sp.]|uniref:BrnA antitoxin family protein n=1 Tax=uncultured Sphingomonas sp. TaxID=158754 RepID=UPI0035C95C52
MNKVAPPPDFDDNPEWTEEEFTRARPASEMHPPHVVAALVRKPGRPLGSTTSTRQQVTLRLEREVLTRLRATGPGWQTRVNEALRKVVGL